MWLIPLISGTCANRPAASAGADRFGEDLAVDDAGDRGSGELGDQVIDRNVTQTRRALIRAANARRKRLAKRFGICQRHLVQRECTALDNRSLEESA